MKTSNALASWSESHQICAGFRCPWEPTNMGLYGSRCSVVWSIPNLPTMQKLCESSENSLPSCNASVPRSANRDDWVWWELRGVSKNDNWLGFIGTGILNYWIRMIPTTSRDSHHYFWMRNSRVGAEGSMPPLTSRADIPTLQRIRNTTWAINSVWSNSGLA